MKFISVTSKSRSPSPIRSSTEMILRSDEEKNLLPRKVKPIENESDHDDGYFHGDGTNVALLLFLYLLQGVPLGLTSAIPIILQNRNVDYSDQAEFSLANWPYSLKILWAPIVDVVYSTRLGKRKSWFVPSQILLGLSLLFVSNNFNDWVGDDEDGEQHTPNIRVLTAVFLLISFLTATQDIALDGWAITMLKRRNRGYVATCTALGQAVGQMIGYEIFIILNSANFSNKLRSWVRWEPQPTGFLSFPTFILFWAVVFIVSTIAVGIFKKEENLDEDTLDVSVRHSYRLLWDILKLKPVQWLSILFLTSDIYYAPSSEVSSLKLVENGLSRDKFAVLALIQVPIQIVLILVVSRRILAPRRQLSIYVTIVPYRLLYVILSVFIVYITSWFKDGNFPLFYYAFVLFCDGYDKLLSDYREMSGQAFFSTISDSRCGATYMALMATMMNLGTIWPSTVTLWLVDVLTWKKCVTDVRKTEMCATYIDGLYVILLPCILIGLVWWRFAKKTVDYLHGEDDSKWLIDSISNHRQIEEEHNEKQGSIRLYGNTSQLVPEIMVTTT